jgi:Resolvase, N terminal domain
MTPPKVRKTNIAGRLRDIRAGETLVVVRLDRLARSVSHLLVVIEQLEAAGAHFRSLRDPVDTCTDAVFDGCDPVAHTLCQFRLR